jgi:hypothetical protein
MKILNSKLKVIYCNKIEDEESNLLSVFYLAQNSMTRLMVKAD